VNWPRPARFASHPNSGLLNVIGEGAEAVDRRSPIDRPTSGFGALCKKQSVLYVDTEIADRVLDLRVTQQDLDRTNVAGSPIDHRGFRPPKRMRAIFGLPKSNCGHPLINEAGILTCAHVSGMIHPAWEEIIDRRATASFQPGEEGRSHVCTGRLVFC